MKKVISGVLAIVIALSVASASAFAACHRSRRNYVDANGDGVCDYAGSYCVYTDADGDGICDNCASTHGRGHGHGCGFRGGCHRA